MPPYTPRGRHAALLGRLLASGAALAHTQLALDTWEAECDPLSDHAAAVLAVGTLLLEQSPDRDARIAHTALLSAIRAQLDIGMGPDLAARVTTTVEVIAEHLTRAAEAMNRILADIRQPDPLEDAHLMLVAQTCGWRVEAVDAVEAVEAGYSTHGPCWTWTSRDGQTVIHCPRDPRYPVPTINEDLRTTFRTLLPRR